MNNVSTSAYPTASWIDPAALMKIRSLELRAKAVVEGFLAGLHRSPYHGFSVEFSEYRQYVAGDDPRYLDWRLLARSDRYYVKRFEDETNLRTHLLVDMSRSMTFASLGYSKADYARTLAATLGYFLNQQRDAVGLVRFDDRIEEFIPARYRVGHLRRVILALEKPAEGLSTNLSRPLDEIAERIRKRGMLVLLSDLLAPLDDLETKLSYFRARGHEVVLFQILDPAESTLALSEAVLLHDLETGREVYIDPVLARESYIERMVQHVNAVRSSCDRLGIDFFQVTTDVPLETALGDFLQCRMRTVTRTGTQRRGPG